MEDGKSKANPAVLLYRPQDLTVELRQPSYFDYTEIRKFSPVILRAVKVPLRDSSEGEVIIPLTYGTLRNVLNTESKCYLKQTSV